MQLSLEADCPTWVVYTERTDQICVEPQTGIPNAFNFDDPQVLEAGKSMELTLTMRWTGFPASRVGHTGYMTGTPKDPQEPQPAAESAHDAELGAYDLDGDGKISMVESERARLGLVDARLEEIAEEGGIKGKLADAAHHVLDKLDND
jgi:hypothetical protein